MSFHDAYDVPTVTTRMFNNFDPRQNPRYITGTIITQALERDFVELGNLEPKRDMCFAQEGVRGHLHVALKGNPGEQYVYGYGENISMQEWIEMILRIGTEGGYWDFPDIVQDERRFRPGDSDVEGLSLDTRKFPKKPGGNSRSAGKKGSVELSTGMPTTRTPGMGGWTGDDRRRLLGRSDRHGHREVGLPWQPPRRGAGISL
jgi:dTDP-glucose 4,6-dehydratase